MFDYINSILLQYITHENLIKVIPIVLLLLVSWTFWGKSWVTEKIGELSKKQKDHVDKVLEETKIEER